MSGEKSRLDNKLFWQHPFVNIFKQFKVEDWKKSSKEGDVTSVLDRHIKCTVYKIHGSIPAGNYIQFPRSTTQSLGLTGRYLYILFKPIPTKYFVVHIDTVAENGLVVRISFSNLFKEFKSTSTWLQFPFACHPAKGSVEHFTSVGARQDFMGPAPLAQKWTMLVLDLHYILSVYINRKYSHIKNLRLCANLLVKNCFTSDINYDPRLSIKQARAIGLKSVDENFAPMPRDMNFYVPKDKEWDELYDVVRFPMDSSRSSKPTPHLPYDSIQRDDEEPQSLFLSHKNKEEKESRNALGVIKSPRRKKPHNVDVSRKHGVLSSTRNMAVSTNVIADDKKEKPKIVPELPSIGLSLMETTAASCSDPNVTLVEGSFGEVHVFAEDCSPDQDIVVHRHFSSKASGFKGIASTDMRSHRTTFRTTASSKNRSSKQRASPDTKDKSLERLTCLEPNPILKLERAIGFGGATINHVRMFRSISAWHPDSSLHGGNDVVVYAVHAVVVAVETANSRQHFFIGHTESVTSVAFNSCQSGSPCILASSQSGVGGIVRIWRFETQKCAAIIRSQHASGMTALAFSQTGAVLVGIGKDSHGKTLLMVWNTSGALRHGTVSVIAKAHTDVEVSCIRVCPTDDTRMVTCGRDNIRFWRVRSNQLRSCPVVIPTEYKLDEITDVKFAPLDLISARSTSESNQTGKLSIYACTKAGYILEVNFQKVVVRNIHKLYPSNCSDATKDEPGQGLALNTLRFTSSYVATGSDDGYLRLWPLDLSSVFLEVEHEGPIVDIDITSDGLKVLAATSVATLGYLDVSTRKYNTIMRSHTDEIRDGCLDGLRRTICTCSSDQTIRVWEVDSMRQSYDFATPGDSPTCISCHPMLEVFACGFASGAVRVFHVSSTTVLFEHTNTGASLVSVVFTPSGQRLITADEKGTMAVYDASDVDHVGAPLLRSLPKAAAPGHRYGPHSIATSPDGRKIAFVGPNDYTVTVASAAMLDELLRIDISTGLQLDPDLLNQKPKVDCPLRLAFSSKKHNQLLVVTKGNRLLKLDAKSGKLLSVTEDMHRSNTTAIRSSDDGRHLVTAGDRLLKVWDYEMSKDISCQVFIGHSSPIHSAVFTPDRLSLITVGEDAIYVWNFLGATGTPRPPAEKEENIIMTGSRREGRRHTPAEEKDAKDDVEECPEPLEPPAPLKVAHHSTTWVPPETLHSSDLDASNVSEFTVDANMMEKLQKSTEKKVESSNLSSKSTEAEKLTESLSDLQIIPEKDTLAASSSQQVSYDVPVKVAWSGKPKTSASFVATTPQQSEAILTDRPNVLSHFNSRPVTSHAAQRTYAAPQGEEGLTLQAVIGYNGNGRRNLLWNPETGLLAYTSGCVVILENLTDSKKNNLLGHTEEIACLAMQHDGQILASASGSCGLVQSKICLWDTTTLSCRATLKHHEHDIVDLAYSRDDRFLISIGDYRERSIVVWSSFDGLSSPSVLTTTKTVSPLHRAIWDPSTSNEFVTIGADATVQFWLLDEHAHKVTLNLHEGDVPPAIKTDKTNERLVHFTAACFGDDHTLFIASNTGLVSAWDTTTNNCFLHWKADSAEITLIKSRGSRLLVAGCSRAVKLWSLTGMKESRFSNPVVGNFVLDDELSLNAEVIAGAFDDMLEMGVVGTTAGTVWCLDWQKRTTVRMVTGHKGKINDIAFDDGNYFATCSEEGTVRLWNIRTFELAVQFQVIDYACTCVVFSHQVDSANLSASMTQPKMLAAGYKDGTLRVFDIDKLILKLKLQPHSSCVRSLQFSCDNNTLLSGGADGTVAATSLATGVTLRVLKDHRGAPINNIACSLRLDHPASLAMHDSAIGGEDGVKLSLICGGDRRVSVWDTAWNHDVCNMVDWLTFPAPCFAPDGRKLPKDSKNCIKLLPPSVCLFHPTNPDLLVYCGYGMDKSIQQYSLTQRKVIKSVPLPNWATCMAVSPNGDLLAIGTGSRLVELVDANHGTFQDFVGHSDVVRHVCFSPDGKNLLSSAGNELLIWRVSE